MLLNWTNKLNYDDYKPTKLSGQWVTMLHFWWATNLFYEDEFLPRSAIAMARSSCLGCYLRKMTLATNLKAKEKIKKKKKKIPTQKIINT